MGWAVEIRSAVAQEGEREGERKGQLMPPRYDDDLKLQASRNLASTLPWPPDTSTHPQETRLGKCPGGASRVLPGTWVPRRRGQAKARDWGCHTKLCGAGGKQMIAGRKRILPRTLQRDARVANLFEKGAPWPIQSHAPKQETDPVFVHTTTAQGPSPLSSTGDLKGTADLAQSGNVTHSRYPGPAPSTTARAQQIAKKPITRRPEAAVSSYIFFA